MQLITIRPLDVKNGDCLPDFCAPSWLWVCARSAQALRSVLHSMSRPPAPLRERIHTPVSCAINHTSTRYRLGALRTANLVSSWPRRVGSNVYLALGLEILHERDSLCAKNVDLSRLLNLFRSPQERSRNVPQNTI